jgi:hypothetical protein
VKILALWRVKGKVKLEGAPDAKADERDILIAVEPSFNAAQVMAEAEGAMLHHWSNQPHTAEIFSLEKTNTKVVAL